MPGADCEESPTPLDPAIVFDCAAVFADVVWQETREVKSRSSICVRLRSIFIVEAVLRVAAGGGAEDLGVYIAV